MDPDSNLPTVVALAQVEIADRHPEILAALQGVLKHKPAGETIEALEQILLLLPVDVL